MVFFICFTLVGNQENSSSFNFTACAIHIRCSHSSIADDSHIYIYILIHWYRKVVCLCVIVILWPFFSFFVKIYIYVFPNGIIIFYSRNHPHIAYYTSNPIHPSNQPDWSPQTPASQHRISNIHIHSFFELWLWTLFFFFFNWLFSSCVCLLAWKKKKTKRNETKKII